MRIGKAIRRNADLIQAWLGSISNIKTSINGDEVMGELQDKEKLRNDYGKYKDIHNKISSVQLADEDLQKSVEGLKPGYLESDSYGEYGKYKVGTQDYLGYLKTNKDRYTEDYNNYYSNESIPLSPEETFSKRFEKAGLKPEDMNFYNEFKKKGFDENNYNRDLQKLVYDNQSNLISRGSLGNQQLANVTDKANSLAFKPDDNEYNYALGKDFVLRYNKKNKNDMEFLPTPDSGKDNSLDKFLDNIGFRIMPDKDGEGNETGKYWYEVPTKDGKWKRTTLDATPEEYKAFLNKIEEKGLSTEDKIKLRKEYSPGRSSSRKRGGPKFTMPDTPEDYGKLKVEDVSKMNLSQLKNLITNKKLINKEVLDAAKDRMKGINSGSIDDSELSLEGDDGSTEDIPEGFGMIDSHKKVIDDAKSGELGKAAEDKQTQRDEIAAELSKIYSAYNSKKYKNTDLMTKINDYIADLEDPESGYDDDVIEEARQTIAKFLRGL